EVSDNLVRVIALDTLIVVSGKECTAVCLPELVLDRCDAGRFVGFLLSNTSNNVKPCDHRPETVLFTDVVASCTKTLLTTDRHLVRVEEGAEEFPARGYLVAVQTLSF